MKPPKIAFACELEPSALTELFAAPTVIPTLQAMGASVHLGLLDLSPERAAVVRQLNAAGIPLVAWLLLSKDEGYWFNLDNAEQAARQVDRFQAWTAAHDLHWAGVGLDIEPDFHELGQMLGPDWWRLLPRFARRAFDARRVRRGLAAYSALVGRLRAAGYRVYSYQFPLIEDERRAGSTLLQRLFGVVDLPTDHEVLMLYSSFVGAAGPGFLWSYGPEAGGIGVGSTGGGVEAGESMPVLTWDELVRDLLLARHWSDEIFLFSLEGCVREGYLERLATFDWDLPVAVPVEETAQAERFRRFLGAGLWASAHPGLVVAAAALLFSAISRLARRLPGCCDDCCPEDAGPPQMNSHT